MGRFIKFFLVIIILAFIGIQFVEVEKSNPQVNANIKAPDKVKNILRDACYDCHSNETVWPWYSKVAPVSWILVDHVNEGRRHLNFSDWEKLYDSKKSELKKKIWDEINHDKMPLKMYTYLHSKSKLDIFRKKTIKEWATKKRPWE